MTIYEDKHCRIAFVNGELIAESKISGTALEDDITKFFEQNNTVILDGVKYTVKIEHNCLGSECYFRFLCDDDSIPDWLLTFRFNYIFHIHRREI